MMKTNPNACAFPSGEALDEKHPNSHDIRNGFSGGGLTKREYFAAMAMQNMATKNRGEYSSSDLTQGYHLDHPKWVAQASVDYADALIAELNKASREASNKTKPVHPFDGKVCGNEWCRCQQ